MLNIDVSNTYILMNVLNLVSTLTCSIPTKKLFITECIKETMDIFEAHQVFPMLYTLVNAKETESTFTIALFQNIS